MSQQVAAPARADPRNVLQATGIARFLAAAAMAGDGESMGLVTHLLDQLQCRRLGAGTHAAAVGQQQLLVARASRRPFGNADQGNTFDPELLQQLRDAGVVPGARGTYRYNEGYVLIQMDGNDEGLELPVELASHIFLVRDEA